MDRVAKLAVGGASRQGSFTDGERRGSFFSLANRRPSVDPGHIDSVVKIAASKITSSFLQGSESLEDDLLKQKKVYYENTYKMLPDMKFNRKKVETVANSVFEKHHAIKGNPINEPYEPGKAAKLCIAISNEIKAKVKELEFDRYKIVVEVTCIPFQDQALRMASRCLWDDKWDDFINITYDKNPTFRMIALVFGSYFE
ncbi:dynein light chain Tctex-type 5-like [Glandiceps talaboti]